MRYQTFSDGETPSEFPVAILAAKLHRNDMAREYLNPGLIPPEEVIAYELYKTGKKTAVVDQKAYLDDLMEILDDLGSTYVLCGDGEYFKTLAGVNKTEAYLGYVLPNKYPEHLAGQFNVIYVPNYRQVFHDPQRTQAKIKQGLDALWDHQHNRYFQPGSSVISFSAYPSTLTDIGVWLDKLMKHDALTCDIEGFSLKHHSAGLGTISFAWNEHEGISFAIDLGEDPVQVRSMLRDFFVNYKGTLIWHNASYDVMVKIFQLFMTDILDMEGLLRGLDVFTNRDWHCTKIVSYLATNTCAGNELSLKELAQEFAGNYAQEDIKDITKIPLPQLLEYNLVDTLSTWFVFNKYYPLMISENQQQVYEELFRPALVDIIQMQICGMPVDMDKVAEARSELEIARSAALAKIQSKKIISNFSQELNERAERERHQDWMDRKAAGVKVRDYTPGSFALEFNPNSPPQKQELFYEVLALPVIERTKTKLPATGADVLEKLKAYTQDPEIIELIDALLDFAEVDKILSTFIPALETSIQGPDGHYYLFGNFNLGGTLSGRLSSSDPNLQNLPAKSRFAKLIKDCFRAPDGWLFTGLDFDSLEDKISALTTKDPNKLKVYTDGFDGHALRAQSYFSEKMPDIEIAPDGARCFKATIGDQEVFFHEHERVTYLGTEMSGAELWDRLANVRTAA